MIQPGAVKKEKNSVFQQSFTFRLFRNEYTFNISLSKNTLNR